MKRIVHGIILAGVALMLTGFMQNSGKPIAASPIPHQKAAVSSASYSKPAEIPETVVAPAVSQNKTASDTAQPENTHVAQSVNTSNYSHADLMAAAGISPNDYWAAEWTVNVESSWNPYAQEPTTGACGLAQELPCGKSGCGFGDAICELSWMQSYVISRYGSWSNEVYFHKLNNWY